MIEAFQSEFMRNALFAGLLAGVACGIIGTLVVVNRIVFISGGIAHAAYGGIGLAIFFGIPPLAGAVGFALVIAMIMSAVTLKNKQRADTVVGVLWAVGMALGIIMIDLTPGYNVDLMSYLFGSILAVPRSDILMMALVDVGVLIIVGIALQQLPCHVFRRGIRDGHGGPGRNALLRSARDDRAFGNHAHSNRRPGLGYRSSHHPAIHSGKILPLPKSDDDGLGISQLYFFTRRFVVFLHI